jgi:FkbM family methyltransferase
MNNELQSIEKIITIIDEGDMKSDLRWENFSEVFLNEVKKSKCYIDCGAEYGFYTYLADKFGREECSIHAFEAEPVRASALLEYFSKSSHISIYPFAVSDSEGQISIYKSGNKSATIDENLSQLSDIEEKTELIIPTKALDDILYDEKPDLIKMDIEGAEVLALPGMKKILRDHRPLVFLEYHPRYVESILSGGKQKIIELIELSNYGIYNFRGQQCDLDYGRIILVPKEKVRTTEFDLKGLPSPGVKDVNYYESLYLRLKLKTILEKNPKISLYGAGKALTKIYHTCDLSTDNIHAIYDDSEAGSSFMNIDIQDIRDARNAPSTLPIVLCTDTWQQEMIKRISNLGGISAPIIDLFEHS